jgi:hypothetical protein
MKNLSVPDIDTRDPVAGNISGVKDEPLASVSITSNTKQIGSSRAQYIPSEQKQRSIAIARGEKVPPKNDTTPGRIHKIRGASYLSADDTAKRMGTVDSEILSLAKELWKEESDARKRYKKAKEIVSKASDDELENPTPRMKKAIKILKKGVLDKDGAKAAAREKLRTKEYS